MITENQDKAFIQLAIAKAEESVAHGGFPAGAIVVKDGKLVGEGISIGNKLHDPTSHGETASIRDACKNLLTADLSNSILYASMEPCLMCFGAAVWSSISKIVFACAKEKVSSDYYGGDYYISRINTELVHPIELVHCTELEEQSLAVVHKWEESIT